MAQIGIAFWNDKFNCYEMLITPPGMNAFRVFMVELEKTKENSPDYGIYYSIYNLTDKTKSIRIGSAWKKVSEKGVNYISGNMLIGVHNGRLLMFEKQPNEDGTKPYDYEVHFELNNFQSKQNPYSAGSEVNNANSLNSNQYQNVQSVNEVSEEEIPF